MHPDSNQPARPPPTPLTTAAAPPSFWDPPTQGIYVQQPSGVRPRSASPSGLRPVIPRPAHGLGYDYNDTIAREKSQALSRATNERLSLEQQIRRNNSLLKTSKDPKQLGQILAKSDQLLLEWGKVLDAERAALAAVTSSLPHHPVASPQLPSQSLAGNTPFNIMFPTPETPSHGHNFGSIGTKIVITSERRIPSAIIIKELGGITAAASSRGLSVVTTEQKQRVKERLRDAARLVHAHAVVDVVLRRDPRDGCLYGAGRAVKLVYTDPKPPISTS